MSFPQSDQALVEALDAIIQGRLVKRSKHDLTHNGVDLSALFVERLGVNGFRPTTVDAVPCEPGERVPAFSLEGSVAWFGWVFWEFFTLDRRRKLWGSVVRNAKGDWAVQIVPSRDATIFANPGLKLLVDSERPSDW